MVAGVGAAGDILPIARQYSRWSFISEVLDSLSPGVRYSRKLKQFLACVSAVTSSGQMQIKRPCHWLIPAPSMRMKATIAVDEKP